MSLWFPSASHLYVPPSDRVRSEETERQVSWGNGVQNLHSMLVTIVDTARTLRKYNILWPPGCAVHLTCSGFLCTSIQAQGRTTESPVNPVMCMGSESDRTQPFTVRKMSLMCPSASHL
uniref:Uncharacterized protein n=1 Tax=Anguilla anguilla TaxID=7936 RepID=A0A0E9XJU2_ANGAN